MLQQLTLSSEVTSSVLYGFSKLHRWRGRRQEVAVETLLSTVAPSVLTVPSIFLRHGNLCPLVYLDPPGISGFFFFTCPILTLCPLACSSFSLSSHSLLRRIHPFDVTQHGGVERGRKLSCEVFTVLHNPPLPHHHGDPLICALPISPCILFSPLMHSNYSLSYISFHFPFLRSCLPLRYSHLRMGPDLTNIP